MTYLVLRGSMEAHLKQKPATFPTNSARSHILSVNNNAIMAHVTEVISDLGSYLDIISELVRSTSDLIVVVTSLLSVSHSHLLDAAPVRSLLRPLCSAKG